jgi:choline dehydrogenase
MSNPSTSYDVIVVGAGTAGSVIAARLSESEDTRVLLLEAGSATPLRASAAPQEWPTLFGSSANWGDSTILQSATGTAPQFPRGRGIGGSSAINGMIFARGHRASYDAWEQAGAKGWSFEDLLPYFKRSETSINGDPALRGIDGPLLVAPADPLDPVFVAGITAAVQTGYRRATDISSGLEIGFGPVDLNIVDGKRQTAADAYLLPALSRPNLELVANATVHRLRIRGGRCTGVEYSIGATTRFIALGGEVVLCAGTIGSAQLLMLSGVGPQSHLRDVGVEVVLDLPGVGANLHDHPLAGLLYRAARPGSPPRNNHGEVVGLIRSSPTAEVAPDLQVLFTDLALASLSGADVRPEDGYAMGVSVMQPHSRGTVRLSGPNPQDSPVIDPNYFGDDRDMQTMITGLRLAREIGAASALGDWRSAEIAPGSDIDIDDETALRAYVRNTFTAYFHPVGTCAIGDSKTSVIDSDLRLHGIRGLRIADASVMPSIPSNNTVASVYAIAERGADLITRS